MPAVVSPQLAASLYPLAALGRACGPWLGPRAYQARLGDADIGEDRQSAEAGDNLAQKFECHLTLRLGVIHAMEESYHASIARSVTKADRQVERRLPNGRWGQKR